MLIDHFVGADKMIFDVLIDLFKELLSAQDRGMTYHVTDVSNMIFDWLTANFLDYEWER